MIDLETTVMYSRQRIYPVSKTCSMGNTRSVHEL